MAESTTTTTPTSTNTVETMDLESLPEEITDRTIMSKKDEGKLKSVEAKHGGDDGDGDDNDTEKNKIKPYFCESLSSHCVARITLVLLVSSIILIFTLLLINRSKTAVGDGNEESTTTSNSPSQPLSQTPPPTWLSNIFSNDTTIELWDTNITGSLSSGHSIEDGGAVSGAWPAFAPYEPEPYMVLTPTGFYTPNFNFTWSEYVDERSTPTTLGGDPNHFFGFVGSTRNVPLAAFGSPNEPSWGLQFLNVTWDGGKGDVQDYQDSSITWKRSAWTFHSSKPGVNAAFHDAINEYIEQYHGQQ